VLVDSQTMEYGWGWVFFYQSKKFLETGDDDFMLWGNAPFIVNKTTGEVRVTGTSRPIEQYVQDYEAELND
jgi:Immunity protein 35